MATELAIRAQYRTNAASLRKDADKAREMAPKKLRGKTAEQWEADAARYEYLVALPDAALVEWFTNCFSDEGRAKNAATYAAR